MNSPPSKTRGWPKRRWFLVLTAGLLLHAALALWLGERARPSTKVNAPEPWLSLPVSAASVRGVEEAPLLADPTLFALPSPNGFSGPAWLSLVPAEAPSAQWTEAPQWLPMDTNALGGLFTLFVATNKHGGPVMEDLLKPRGTTADILLLGDMVMTQSVVQIEGPLAQRVLAVPLRAPNPVHPDALSDTVIKLKVNPDGWTESAILMTGCGVKGVDDQALAVARSARFERLLARRRSATPPSPDQATWGSMVFHWYTLSPATTNLAVLTAP